MSTSPPRKPAGIDEPHEKAGCVRIGVVLLWVPSFFVALALWDVGGHAFVLLPFVALLVVPNLIAGTARGPLGAPMRITSLVLAALLVTPFVLALLGLR